MIKKMLIIFCFILSSLTCFAGSIRRFSHVKDFYQEISEITVNLSVKHNTPPAVVLAIAGLESGYGQGYVAQITGNVLSLSANKEDTQLPPLHLPKVKKTNKIIYDTKEINGYSKEELSWADRPRSRKIDYRPTPYCGTKENLAYFKYHSEEKKKAVEQNIRDFLTKWLNENYQFEVFAEAKKYLETEVKQKGKDILFDLDFNKNFIKMIGGKPRSFNTNESWVKKVSWILENGDLLNLSKKIYYDKLSFDEAWKL